MAIMDLFFPPRPVAQPTPTAKPSATPKTSRK
jgi:hypothetical protein